MLINVSEHPWRSKKEYEDMLYPVDEDLFSVATAEYEADREMDWEDEVAGTVGTLGENNEFYYETMIELSSMKKEPNTKTCSMVRKICDEADESVRNWCWKPEDFDEDPENWSSEMWVVWSKSVVDEEIRIAEDYLKDSHEHLEYTIKSNRLRVGPEKMMKWIMDTVEEFKYGETCYWRDMKLEFANDGIVELIMDSKDGYLPEGYEDRYERCNEPLDKYKHYCEKVVAMKGDWEHMGESELVEEYFESDHIVQLAYAMADGRINDAIKVMAHFWETYYEKRISFRYCDDEYYALESASRRKGDVMKVAKHE